MNSLIEWMNVWGGRLVEFALPLLVQSSLLIAVVFAVDLLLRRKVRAAIRYSLWFAVLVKLLLPPTLALPTGAAWWLRSRPISAVTPHTRTITADYSEAVQPYVPPVVRGAPVVPPAPTLSREAWMGSITSAVTLFLAMWMLLRWKQIARCVRRTTEADAELTKMLAEAQRLAGLGRKVTLRVTAEAMSPAVCGLFRPVILLPQSLIAKLTPAQLRAVLLHELIHLRRCDVWVNCAQTLMQIVYWWHPLLWIANARVRRLREEAVDDAVMCALNAEAEVYAPTLLEVAKLAFARPLASLGLVGILESRSALRHRIERLLNSTTPRRAGVSVMSVICLAAFTALAVPIGEPPARPAATDELATEKLIQYKAKVDPEVFVRNVQARADATMHTTNDDLNAILVSIMDGFGVDCTGERAIQFDTATGMLTTKNTSEALGVLDEVVKELNLKGGEHVLNPPHGLKQVLLEGRFYLVSPEVEAQLPLTPEALHHEGELSPWWELSPTRLTQLRQQLQDLGLAPLSAGRIQTSHGSPASLFTGDGTNDVRFDCVPYVHDNTVNFTVLARTTGNYAPTGKSWPDIAGHTNAAIFSRITVTNGGAGILRAQQAGADRDLIILLSAKIVEPVAKKPAPVNATRAPAPDGQLYTYTFRLDLDALNQRLKKFAETHQINRITSNPAILTDFLANAGVDTYPSKSFFYQEENGHANLTLHTTQQQLQRAAEALGLNWKTEQALNQGKSIDIDKLERESKSHSTPIGTVHYYDYYKTNGGVISGPGSNSADYNRYKTNFTASPSDVAQLVQDGKTLFQLGKSEEAAAKLEAALAQDPNNKAAQYYMNLIKQTRARNLPPPGEGAARNVPGPGARPDDATPMVRRVQDEPKTPNNSAGQNLPVPNPYAHTNTIYTSPQRQKLYAKLNDIRFDKIAFPNLPLSEVIRTLSEQTQRQDVDQLGINFILNKTKPPAAPINPTTGQPNTAANAQAEDVDLSTVMISLDPALRNVRLLDVLEAITKSSDHPISYSLLDYGIEFRLKDSSEQAQLHTRTFKVDPNTFYMGLQNVGVIHFGAATTGGSGGNQGNFVQVPKVNITPGTAGNGAPTREQIQTGVINFFKAVGVNLAAPKSVFFNDRVGTLTVRATDEDLELIEQAINTQNIAPPQVNVKARFVEINDEDMFKPGFEWFLEMMARHGTNGLTGIITEPQFKTLLKNIEQRKGADLLNEGQVTTLSGRQANFQVIEIDTNQAPGNQITNTPYGTSLDVVSYVAADGYTIQLTVIPTITERVEYPPPGNFVPSPVANGGVPVTSFGQLSIPHTRVRQTVMSCIIWDGQTAVLLLGPYVPHQKNTVVFVTPTVIDATGNRKNSDASLEFAQKAIPPQPAH